MAGSSSGRLHCSRAGAPQHHLYHSWRWENFPESDVETQETVKERRALHEGWFSATAISQGKTVWLRRNWNLEMGKTREDHHSQCLSTFRQCI